MPNKSAFDSIKRGLREAVEHAKGRPPATRIGKSGKRGQARIKLITTRRLGHRELEGIGLTLVPLSAGVGA